MIQLNKNQQKVIELFRKNLFLKTSIRHIMRLLKTNSYARIHEAVAELEKIGILKTEKLGQAKIVELMLANETISLFTYIEESEAGKKTLPGIENITALEELSGDIIIVAGSYAKGLEKKGSDIDLAIITKGDPFKKQKLIENLTLSNNPPIHPIVFSEKNFKEMLLDKEENFGKETYKNRLILKNARRYYELIKEAKENGFRG